MAFPVDRIRAICKERKTTLAEVERATGIGNGVIARWENQKSSPPIDRLRLIASHLDVPLSSLTGNDQDDETKKEPAASEGCKLSDDDIKFAVWGGSADQISDEELEEVRRFAAFIAERRRREGSGDR